MSKTLRILIKHAFYIKFRFYIVILKRVLFRGKFYLGQSHLLFPNLHFISLTTKNKLNLENDRILEWHKERLGLNELVKPQKKEKKNFFIAVNNFSLRLKPSHRTILQTCRPSPSDEEISSFWFISPRLVSNISQYSFLLCVL